MSRKIIYLGTCFQEVNNIKAEHMLVYQKSKIADFSRFSNIRNRYHMALVVNGDDFYDPYELFRKN